MTSNIVIILILFIFLFSAAACNSIFEPDKIVYLIDYRFESDTAIERIWFTEGSILKHIANPSLPFRLERIAVDSDIARIGMRASSGKVTVQVHGFPEHAASGRIRNGKKEITVLLKLEPYMSHDN